MRKRKRNARETSHSKGLRSRNLTRREHDERIKCLDALNLYRQGKAKTVSAAAHMAKTSLKAMRRWVPLAIDKDSRTGRLRVKASDRYSEKVEILTYSGALVATARGSRERQLAGQHRATYMAIAEKTKPASALEEFRGKKVGGHELLSDYQRLIVLAKAGVLGKLDALYVSAGGGR